MSFQRSCVLPAVHPRMRGERHWAVGWHLRSRGSSPHARGTPKCCPECVSHRRFIPACAGNARPAYNVPGSMAVHPRMRGERIVGGLPCNLIPGSSPHARGTPPRDDPDRRVARFIPACAGNALPVSSPSNWRAVHPRMRGERYLDQMCAIPAAGSSPHARGTRHRQIQRRAHHRFIPACAGNARHNGMSVRFESVHPRMRGERCRGFGLSASRIGSSPHARGTPAAAG